MATGRTVTGPDLESTVELASRLRLTATRLARRLRREAGTGLTPSQLSALATVDRKGPLTLGDLAECEQVAPPSITKVIAKLVGEGLVARETDATDGRVSHVTITPIGAELLGATRERKDAWLALRLDDLSPADRRRLADALDVLEALAGGAP